MMKMNKLITLFVMMLLGSFVTVNSQTTSGTPVATYPVLTNKIKKTEKDLENPKKTANPKYWLGRSEVMMDAYYVNLEQLAKGAQQMQMQLMFGQPTEKKTEVKDGVTYETQVYERVNITYVNGVVDSYEETKPLYDNPLPVAYEALEKTEELDVDKKLDKKINEDYTRLADLFERDAIENFVAEDYEGAFKSFEYSVNIGEKPIMNGVVDTTTIFNTGMAASRAGLDEESIKYYELARSYNYPEPSLYVFLKNKYFAVGDTTKGLDVLVEGFEKHPENQDIVIELINYYLLSGKADEALNYIRIAQEKDPENVSLIFAEATLYDKQKEFDKAETTYKKTFEIDPTYYNGYYNLGVLYYNKAQSFYEESNSAPDSEYKSIIAKGDEELKKAIPMMEKCYELNPDDNMPLETLKSIYYRLKMDAEYQEVKAKLGE